MTLPFKMVADGGRRLDDRTVKNSDGLPESLVKTVRTDV
jgi:hypothetical protein